MKQSLIAVWTETKEKFDKLPFPEYVKSYNGKMLYIIENWGKINNDR